MSRSENTLTQTIRPERSPLREGTVWQGTVASQFLKCPRTQRGATEVLSIFLRNLLCKLLPPLDWGLTSPSNSVDARMTRKMDAKAEQRRTPRPVPTAGERREEADGSGVLEEWGEEEQRREVQTHTCWFLMHSGDDWNNHHLWGLVFIKELKTKNGIILQNLKTSEMIHVLINVSPTSRPST